MTNPMSVDKEAIQKALDAAIPGPWTFNERALLTESGEIIGVFDIPPFITEKRLIANAPTWLRALLEENRHLEGMFDDANRRAAVCQTNLERITKERDKWEAEARLQYRLHNEMIEESRRYREELEQLREDLPGWKVEIAELRSELAAKDKVLEEIANYPGNATGEDAREMRDTVISILSQYQNE